MKEFKVGDKVLHKGYTALVLNAYPNGKYEIRHDSGDKFFVEVDNIYKIKDKGDMNFINMDLTNAELLVLREFMNCFGSEMFDTVYKHLPVPPIQNVRDYDLMSQVFTGLDCDAIAEYALDAVTAKETVEINGKTYYVAEIEQNVDYIRGY